MQNFEPTGAAAAMPGSAVPQLKRRLVISACLLIPLFYLGLGAAFGLPLPPFLTGDNAMWCGIVQLVLTVPVCWLNRSYFINGCKSIRAPGPDTLVALSSGAALVYGIIAIFTQDAPQELFLDVYKRQTVTWVTPSLASSFFTHSRPVPFSGVYTLSLIHI